MLLEAKKALFYPKNEKKEIACYHNLLLYYYIFLCFFSRLRIV